LIECQKRSILGPDLLVCVSAPWVERVRREYGVGSGLVRNGVDTRRYRPPRDAAERRHAREAFRFGERFVVLTIGGIEPRKGSLTLLEGFARLCSLTPELDPLLIVAGGATLFDYRHEIDRFHTLVGQLGLEDSVRVLGSLPDGEPERLYRAADVFAFPSTSEGFGLAALEALASGLPVVATDLDALRTFLEHDHSALLHPVGDSEAVGAALARVAHDAPTREKLRAGGRRVAVACTWDAAADAHERVYRELLGSLEPAGADRG
jgi:glycosyltransferase involved in cell wall biosynthesis